MDTQVPRQRILGRPGLVWLLRSVLVSMVIVVGYFVLPFTSPLTSNTILVLVGGVGLVAALLVWEIRSIRVSPYPRVRAVGTLLLAMSLFLVVFAATYHLMARADPEAFSEPISRLDAVYFTVTTFATVGFGDIHAVSGPARAVVTAQIVADLILIGLITRLVLRAVQEGLARRGSEPG